MDDTQKPPGTEDVEHRNHKKNCGTVPHIICIADGNMHDCKALIELSDTDSKMQQIFAMATGMQDACHLIKFDKRLLRAKRT